MDSGRRGVERRPRAPEDRHSTRTWTIAERETLESLSSLMRDKRVRRLVVLDEEERPTGVVTLGDLAHRVEPAK